VSRTVFVQSLLCLSGLPLPPSFHLHSLVSDFRSVPVGRSRFNRCCSLIFDLTSVFRMEVGPGDCRSHRNLAVETRQFGSSSTLLRLARTDCVAVRRPHRSPTVDEVVWTTFAPTATTARFLAFLPPRSASVRPQRRRSLSAPKGAKNVVRALHHHRS
jgi:hypothetical protein